MTRCRPDCLARTTSAGSPWRQRASIRHSGRWHGQPRARGPIEEILLPVAQHLKLPVEVAIVHPTPTEAVAEADVEADEPDLADRHEHRDRGDIGFTKRTMAQVLDQKRAAQDLDALGRRTGAREGPEKHREVVSAGAPAAAVEIVESNDAVERAGVRAV